MYVRRELAQLVSDHVLGYDDVVVYLAVVHLEQEAHEVGQDGGGAGLCPDRLYFLARQLTRNGKTVDESSVRKAWSGTWTCLC